jgi:predicted permease
VCLLLGMALHWLRRVPDNTHIGLSAFIINVSLPSLTLVLMHTVDLRATLVLAAIMPWLVFLVSLSLFATIGYWLKLPRTTLGALIVVAGLGNTSFVGLPMIESFYGSSGMPIGIVIDQLGTYLVLSTIGILTISLYSEG